jgi:hypothetical protein
MCLWAAHAGDAVSLALVASNSGTLRLKVSLAVPDRIRTYLKCVPAGAIGTEQSVEPGSAINCMGSVKVGWVIQDHSARPLQHTAVMCCFGTGIIPCPLAG